eukprot:14398415-Heterocapsa_arctica.AAC.1
MAEHVPGGSRSEDCDKGFRAAAAAARPYGGLTRRSRRLVSAVPHPSPKALRNNTLYYTILY